MNTTLELHNLILSWAADHSGSDYIYMMRSNLLDRIPMAMRHRVAVTAINALEKYEPGPVGRHIGMCDEGVLSYTIGGVKGGTEILFSEEGATVISYYYDMGVRKEKGRVKIVPAPSSYEDELPDISVKENLTCEWSFSNGSEHSYGRLEDLVSDLSSFYYIYHTGDNPDRVLRYNHDPEVGGGF